jgi:Beta-lactamase class C and other penicillin binding proteins
MLRAALACLPCVLMSAAAGGQSLEFRADSVMRAAEAQGFSGVVRVEKDGRVVLEKGYGKANREAGIAFTPATVVQIGSNTKDFTTVAILQLQDRGKLRVTDQLGKFFPDAPADKSGITLLQLMHHRAGFPIGLGGDFEPVTRDELIANAMKFKLLFTPGTRENYSNTGYSILAAVIEKVTGQTYDEYVKDNILAPLNLTHTGFLLPHFADNSLAHGYAPGGRDAGTMLAKPHAPDGPYWNLRGNGAMLSTVDDMHVFYKALFETDKLVTPASRAIMFNPNDPIGLAGSDLVNFFLYERDPIAHTEMIIASTNAEQKAPIVRRSLARILGLPLDVGKGDDKDVADKPLEPGKPPSAGIASVIQRFIAVINQGDEKALLAFVTANFETGPGMPSPEERVQRIGGMHANLGAITIRNMSDSEDGPVRVVIQTEKTVGGGVMNVDVARSAPFKIKRVGLLLGGD